MPWTKQVARQRIERLITTVPAAQLIVEDFERFYEEQTLALAKAMTRDTRGGHLLRIPRNRAITTDGVHIYANLMDFNDQLLESGRETEASHERALQTLDLHYSGCDQLIETFGLQRVDFHGPRLHAVVLTPTGAENEAERVAKALAFAAAFREMVSRSADLYGARFRTRVRIGVDSGPAVAMDNGKRDEPDPLFIGSPANHAAKLAEGEVEGMFLSQRVHRLSQVGLTQDSKPEVMTKALRSRFLGEDVLRPSPDRRRLDLAFDAFNSRIEHRRRESGVAVTKFHFHTTEPPLKKIVFADHPPHNSLRLNLASVFADLAGFTAYVDRALYEGRVAEAVANLHVLRGELAAVLRDDFGGRKVRFVGDCVHGLLAVGKGHSIDAAETIKQAVMAAAAMRSSFELCREMLPGVADLGLAIGVEFGPTPICRIGLRGEASVRCAASRTTCRSEAEQQDCDEFETAIGEAAHAQAPARLRQVFGPGRKIAHLTYPNAERLLVGLPSPFVQRSEPVRAHAPAPPMRAHGR